MEKYLNNFKIFLEDDYEAMSKKAAEIVCEQINNKPDSVIGFATGSTPVSMYKQLVLMHKENSLDFSKITAFNLDEYAPIKKNNNQSYDYFMKENLFNHVNVNFDKLNIPNGEAENYTEECLQYEDKIKNAGGIDFQILGIGNNAHIGFNEPSAYFEPMTHYVKLEDTTIEANARFFASLEEVPKHAISMGIGTIMKAKKIMLLVSGENKADALKKTIFGKITPGVPASVLQLHPNLIIITDKAAAKYL